MDLEKKEEGLPISINELNNFILFGEEKFKNITQQIKSINKLDLGKEVYEKKLEEAQKVGSQVLEAKVKMGELLNNTVQERGNKTLGVQGSTKTLPENINKKQSYQYQELYRNKDLVQQEIEEAKENEDLPTTRNILKNIAIKRREEQKEKFNSNPVMPNGLFNVVYVDPPYKYDFSNTDNRKIENHYPTMDIDKICTLKLPIDKDAVLFLWSPSPKLLEALKILEAWGFEYKTNAIWNKEIIGMGYWFRSQHEILLVGTKGNFSPPDTELRITSVYSEKRTEHSKKPEYYYNLIEKLFPNGKYLEIFARQKYNEKWSIYSNEI